MKFLYYFVLFCLLLRQSYGRHERYNQKYWLMKPIYDSDFSSSSSMESKSEEDNYFEKSQLFKALRKRRDYRNEPTYDMIGSFGTILWEPKPEPLEKKMLKGYFDDC